MGRSRKRTDKMNRIKRARNYVKELATLKKTLGLIDADGNEIIKKVENITNVKDPKEMKKKKKEQMKEDLRRPVVWDVKDIADDPELVEEKVTIVHKNTGKEHIYSTKTLRDQYGQLPVWANRNKTKNKLKRHMNAKKKKHDSFWTCAYVPFD